MLERSREALRKHGRWIASLAGGFLLGRVTNSASDRGVGSFADLLRDTLDWNRDVNSLTWIAVGALVGLPLARAALDLRHRRQGHEYRLAALVQSRTDPSLRRFARSTIAWGPALTLQWAPDLRHGWGCRDIRVRYQGERFTLSEQDRREYETYRALHASSRSVQEDGDKFMLAQNPVSFSDARTLVLEIKRAKYSEIQYFRAHHAQDRTRRDGLLDSALASREIRFPHSLCLHLVVATADRRILATRRSPKVDYSPGSWSISMEEQISELDLHPGNDGVMQRWTRRALFEELGLGESDFDMENLHVLSLFLESDILNCSLAAIALLGLKEEELSAVLEARVRTDYEFSDYGFLTYDELAGELLQPSRPLHPTSGYRSFAALVKHWGAPRFAELLLESGNRVGP
jgi:hypothetical protein